MACLTPKEEHPDRTLDYATRARQIVSRAVMNYEMKEGVTMEDLLMEVAKLNVCFCFLLCCFSPTLWPPSRALCACVVLAKVKGLHSGFPPNI